MYDGRDCCVGLSNMKATTPFILKITAALPFPHADRRSLKTAETETHAKATQKSKPRK